MLLAEFKVNLKSLSFSSTPYYERTWNTSFFWRFFTPSSEYSKVLPQRVEILSKEVIEEQ